MSVIKVLAMTTALAGGLGMKASAQEAAPPDDAILVLDASGSMWGQIDGVNKIVIAKDVVEGLVRSLPDNQRLGMVAYGHRKKGDCSDIQTLADVGAERGDVIEAVRALSPRGMTPLTDSVQHAATALDYTKNAASVILVSDGLETCDADPCALARTLEENGLDFTVHVIGFDVTVEERAGLQCIADETGGEFLAADNAEELTSALGQVTAVSAEVEPEPGEPAAEPVEAVFKATILKNGPDIQSELDWSVMPADGGDVVFSAEDTGYSETMLAPGSYEVTATWHGWPHDEAPKTGTVTFEHTGARVSVITVPIDLGIPVMLETDEEIVEGHSVNVRWSGPDDLGAYLTTNALDDGPRDQIYSTLAKRARDAYEKDASGEEIDTNGDGTFDQDDMAETEIGGPSIPGEFEVRYVLDSPRLILARRPLTVVDNPHRLSAPESVPVSTEFEIDWTGEKSRDGDFLVLVQKDEEGRATAVTPRVRLTEGEPAVMLAAPEPGEYEIQYVLDNGYTTYAGMDNAVQETVPITVTAVEATITAPDTAVGGSTITAAIEPPEGWEDDGLSVVEPGATKTNAASRYMLSRIHEEDGSFSFRVPAIAGDYEIAYFLNPGAEVIARRPITITQAEATVDAPDTVKIGEAFEISYSGDAFAGDRIIIAPADAEDEGMWGWGTRYGFAAEEGASSGTISERRSADILAKGPGDYVVRYVSGQQHVTLARDTMTVTE